MTQPFRQEMDSIKLTLKLPSTDNNFKPSLLDGDRPDFIWDVADILLSVDVYRRTR